jgi:hypothetical protein
LKGNSRIFACMFAAAGTTYALHGSSAAAPSAAAAAAAAAAAVVLLRLVAAASLAAASTSQTERADQLIKCVIVRLQFIAVCAASAAKSRASSTATHQQSQNSLQ